MSYPPVGSIRVTIGLTLNNCQAGFELPLAPQAAALTLPAGPLSARSGPRALSLDATHMPPQLSPAGHLLLNPDQKA